jgi:hypothetical protein
MVKAKAIPAPRTNTEVGGILLGYLYDRNNNATSSMGKKGSAVKISDVKGDLKAQHGLSMPAAELQIPSVSSFYQITASGIDQDRGAGRVRYAQVPWIENRGYRPKHHHAGRSTR